MIVVSAKAKKRTNDKKPISLRMRRDWMLYVMAIPMIVWFAIFCYAPMGGVILSFKDYKYNLGVFGSPFNNFKHFKSMFGDDDFWRAVKNTVIFSLGNLILGFPFPVIVAILLNEIRSPKSKKLFQTVFTFPHFISWVVLSGILVNLFGSEGIVNQVFKAIGAPTQSWLTSLSGFRPFIWISAIMKSFGWDSIIYLAALTGIDPQLYEAAEIDGASRLQKMGYITWPGIRSTVCVMLILSVGSFMSGASFDQVFNLYSSPVYPVADMISTYVYRLSFINGADWGYTTAIGLLQSVIGMILLAVTNKIVTKAGENGLF